MKIEKCNSDTIVSPIRSLSFLCHKMCCTCLHIKKDTWNTNPGEAHFTKRLPLFCSFRKKNVEGWTKYLPFTCFCEQVMITLLNVILTDPKIRENIKIFLQLVMFYFNVKENLHYINRGCECQFPRISLVQFLHDYSSSLLHLTLNMSNDSLSHEQLILS